MTESNPFDLSSLEDIPQEIRKELRVLSRDAFEKNILKLFSMAKRPLSLDEITVAYYRVFKEEKDRKQIMAKLYNMSRADKPLIKSVEDKKGVYEATSDNLTSFIE